MGQTKHNHSTNSWWRFLAGQAALYYKAIGGSRAGSSRTPRRPRAIERTRGLAGAHARLGGHVGARGLKKEVVPAVTPPNPCVNSGTCKFTPDLGNLREMAHGALDLAGLVPGAGEVADGLNGLWYLAEGDHLSAGLSFAGMLPFLGWGATAGKGAKAVNEVSSAATGTPLY